ncbi:MAG TPA: potassium channel family protein [Thermoanaerobaculia bacterium]|nr:potassium channel family protein [Thermoanaerobaculia bacterium]
MRRPAAFSRIWWQEWGLSAMLVFLLLTLFVALPLETLELVSPAIVGVVMTFLFVAGVVAMSGRGLVTLAVAVFASASLVVRWLSMVFTSRALVIWDFVLAMLALAMLTAFVLKHVFRAGPITADRIRGSIVAYLLIGVLWCVAYQLIHFLVPGAFNFPDKAAIVPRSLSHRLVYFSFITLTTVGYGDITPVYPVARTLAAVEGLIGQLYPAILIARLVSLQISSRPSDAPH